MKKSVKTVSNPNPRALTHDVLTAIKNKVKSGSPLVTRKSEYLLLESHKILKNTYLSWLRRGVVPIDSPYGMSLQEVVTKAREQAFLKKCKKLINRGQISDLEEVSSINLRTEKRFIRQTGSMSITETTVVTNNDINRFTLVASAHLKYIERTLINYDYLERKSNTGGLAGQGHRS